jgi:hypothetical protein
MNTEHVGDVAEVEEIPPVPVEEEAEALFDPPPDTTLPAAEAITQVAEQVNGAEQMRLPGTTPPFNLENAFKHIYEKERESAIAWEKADDLADRTKKARKQAEEYDAELRLLIERYHEDKRQRELQIEREAQGLTDGTTLVRCQWERMNVGEPCPVCSSEDLKNEPRFGARDSEQHAVEVRNWQAEQDTCKLRELLLPAGIVIDVATIAEWSPEQRRGVELWVEDAMETTSSLEEARKTLPEAFGKPHVLDSEPGFDGEQAYGLCSACNARLFDIEDPNADELPYPAGTLVGTDCSGEPARTLPKRGSKKRAAKGGK